MAAAKADGEVAASPSAVRKPVRLAFEVTIGACRSRVAERHRLGRVRLCGGTVVHSGGGSDVDGPLCVDSGRSAKPR